MVRKRERTDLSLSLAFGILATLRFLYLNGNLLTGAIPPELGNLITLVQLYLNDNQLTGAIPPELELGSLAALQRLLLFNNHLTGAIPIELLQLTNLVEGLVGLSSNHLFTDSDSLREFLSSKHSVSGPATGLLSL